jgi:Fe-S-cluster containining protein
VVDTTFPFRFRCQRSGNCCARPEGIVRVTPDDVARIAAHLGLSEAAFRSRYVAASGDRLAEGLGPRCVFLADGAHATCTIYPVRPERCRTWPFWDEHRDPAALAAAARVCPGIMAARPRAGSSLP